MCGISSMRAITMNNAPQRDEDRDDQQPVHLSDGKSGTVVSTK